MALHCPECGFVNAEGANYCQKCGAFLGDAPRPRDRVVDGDVPRRRDRRADAGRARGRRRRRAPRSSSASGGGRVGESFPLDGERMTIGRRPDSDVFLDDVTVSRDHALLVHRGDGWHLDDLGSLNGTYVNRRRIESHRLADGDELQVGKYKLTLPRSADGRPRRPPRSQPTPSRRARSR